MKSPAALELARPEANVRVFVDEGQPVRALLEAAVRGGLAADDAWCLLSTMGTPEDAVRALRQAWGGR